MSFGFAVALSVGDCLARPVARMLIKPRKGVKNRAFSDVGIARESYNLIAWILLFYNKA